jgi:hypothetical protein
LKNARIEIRCTEKEKKQWIKYSKKLKLSLSLVIREHLKFSCEYEQ